MENILYRKNENTNSALGVKPKKKYNKYGILRNASSKKFGTGINYNQNNYQNISSLLSNKLKAIFNHKTPSKKDINIDNSLSNSNIIIKTSEEKLISNTNSNINEKSAMSTGNKLEGSLIKKTVKFFEKILTKEKELNKEDNFMQLNSSKIIKSKFIKDIEKENNIIRLKISKQKRKSAVFTPGFSKNNVTKALFKFGKNKKKKQKNSEHPTFNNIKKNESLKKRRMSMFSTRESLQIKSFQNISSEILKKIRRQSVRDIKNEIKQLETLDINKMIEKSPIRKDTNSSTLKSLELTNLSLDILKYNKIKDFEYQKKFRNLFISNNLYDSLDDDENENMEKLNSFYIGPTDLTCYIIDSFSLIASIISFIYIPYFLVNNISDRRLNIFSLPSILFYFIDLVYLIDLFTGFFKAFYNFEEVLIIKKRYMILNYLSGWFFLDLIEAIPYFIIFNSFLEDCDNKNCMNYAFGNHLYFSFLILKILKLLKLYQNSTIKAINKFLDKSRFLSERKAIFENIFIIVFSIYLVSSYFIFLGNNYSPGWQYGPNLENESLTATYIAAIYYVMTTLTTVGYGDISIKSNHERIFQIILLIIGTIAYSWVLTYISNYIKKKQEKYIVYEEKMNMLEEIKINYPNLNKNLYDRISRYFSYNKKKYKNGIKYLLDSLPSSIQNNLIIEIYKPIIKNFLFFKDFENSDFFVKIVTSMKPILSMKDDILIQEGDIIEDIIFIKSGILSLEIGINLEEPQKYLEDQLQKNQTAKKRFDTLSNLKSFTQIKSIDNYSFLTFNTKKTKKIEIKQVQKKKIKIIDLRKNEHFGDVLMILNEKSPVTIRVRTKKAELLFLQKTEATEISNLYPNIWKKIETKSLYNMNQIKNIIKQKIINYCKLNDIHINADLEKNNSSHLKHKIVKFKSNSISKKGKKIKKIKIPSIIPEVDESKFFSGKNSTLTKNSINKISFLKNNLGSRKSNFKTSSILNNKEKNTHVFFEEKDNEDNKDMSQSNNIMSDISGKIKNKSDFARPKSKTNSDINIEKFNKNSEDKKFERINEEMVFNEDIGTNIINKFISMDNHDNNNFIYNKDIKSKEKNEDFTAKTNSNDAIKKLLKDNDIANSYFEKKIYDNNYVLTDRGNEKINIYNNFFINNPLRNGNIIENNFYKNKKFECLQNFSADSFSINSTYENINQMTKYKYSSNSFFRQKVRKYIMQISFSRYKTLDSAKIKTALMKENNSPIKSKNKFSHSTEKNVKQNINNHLSLKTQILKQNFKSPISDKGNLSIKKTPIRKMESAKNFFENENTFYQRFKTLKQSKKSVKLNDKDAKLSLYEEQISKNIEKNKQNLNNPEEYFNGFFSNLLSRKNLK